MTNIAVDHNTFFPCIFTIRAKGYQVELKDRFALVATKGENTFTAASSEALLGIITMYEHRGSGCIKWSDAERVPYADDGILVGG